MGIVNVTPDSFSDGGRFLDPGAAAEQALRLAGEGAEIVDVGGESTRPGSAPVPAEEQIRRVRPVVEAIRRQSGLPLSVDTSLAAVAAAALDAGADVVNDISALRGDAGMGALVVARGCPVVLMHMRGTPATMQENPAYENVTGEVAAFLAERRNAALAAGIAAEKIVLDPGFGFGKTAEHNLALLAGLGQLCGLGAPLLVGLSRKSVIGAVLGLPVEERLEGSLAAAVLAVRAGARILRVHDVRATVRAVRFAEAVPAGAA